MKKRANIYAGINRTCTMCKKTQNITRFSKINATERRHECKGCVGIEAEDWQERVRLDKQKAQKRSKTPDAVVNALKRKWGKAYTVAQKANMAIKQARDKAKAEAAFKLAANLPLEELNLQ